jgi:hypothetical protein
MTNEDLLRTQLEQVTAPGREPADDCGAETRQLRETWIAMGNLLESTNAGDDTGPVQVLPRRASQQAKRSSSVSWAVAASVLFMAGLAAWFGLNREQSNKPSAQAIASAQKELPSGQSEATLAIDPEATAWDDSLDGELASLSQAASLLDTSWRTRSTRLTAVGDALEEIEQEFQQGTF